MPSAKMKTAEDSFPDIATQRGGIKCTGLRMLPVRRYAQELKLDAKLNSNATHSLARQTLSFWTQAGSYLASGTVCLLAASWGSHILHFFFKPTFCGHFSRVLWPCSGLHFPHGGREDVQHQQNKCMVGVGHSVSARLLWLPFQVVIAIK